MWSALCVIVRIFSSFIRILVVVLILGFGLAARYFKYSFWKYYVICNVHLRPNNYLESFHSFAFLFPYILPLRLCSCFSLFLFPVSHTDSRSKYVPRRRRRRADFIFGPKRMHEKYTKISVVPLVFLSFAGTDFFFLIFRCHFSHFSSIPNTYYPFWSVQPKPTTHLAFHFSFVAYYSERLLHVYHSMSQQ